MDKKKSADWRRHMAWMVVSLLALGPSAAGAQTVVNGSINGTITDETGATLPGVTITLTSSALQVPQLIRVSDVSGDYRFPALPPGVYRLAYELPGFATLVREDIRLTTAFAARVDVVLNVSAVAETITVSGESPLVDLTNTRGGTTVSGEILSTTPNSLTMQDVFLITGGITAQTSPKNGEGGVRSMTPLQIPVTFGQRYNGMTLHQTLEGVWTIANQYPDFATLEEADIRTFGNSAEVGTPGYASILVVKSGGNEFHGDFRAAYQTDKWQADNVDARLRAQGITQGRVLKYFYDVSGDLGGRLVRNKLWFFGGYHYFRNEAYLPGFSLDKGPDGIWSTADDTPALSLVQEPAPTIKLSLQATPQHRFVGFYAKNTLVENTYTGAKFIPFESTYDYHQPFPTAKGEWQGTLGDRLYVSTLYGFHSLGAFRNAQPCCASMPSTYDMATLQQAGSAWGDLRGFRRPNRYQLSGTASYLPSGSFLGTHQITAGWGLVPERFEVNFPVQPSGDYRLVFNNGTPTQFWTRNTPAVGDSWQNIYYTYATDSWRVTRQLTLNVGLRFERFTNSVPAQVKEPGPWPFARTGQLPEVDAGDWNLLAPRVGAAFDLFGDGKTVVKGTYGRFNHEHMFGWVGMFNPNYVSTTVYRWTDPDGNRAYTPGEINLDPNGPDVLSITGSANFIVNPDLKVAHSDELTASIEREFPGAVSLRALYVYKHERRMQTTNNTLRPYSVWNQQVVRQDPGPDGRAGSADDGALVTFYDYDPAYRGSRFVANTIINTNRENSYNNLELSLRKRQSGKWFAFTSFLVTKNHRWVVAAVDGPNDEIFPMDETWNWSYRLTGGYEVPYGIMLSTIYQAENGVLGQRTVNFAAPTSGSLSIRTEPFGAYRGPTRRVMNVRVSKRLTVGRNKFSLNADAFNLFNTNVAWTQSFVSGPSYGVVTDFNQSRVVRLSASIEF